ncbi:MAG: glycogen debranching protein GlgX [Eubacteriales bacterium]|nr:glycogen debranching protein GlgX [Eubacteriales bacterium]
MRRFDVVRRMMESDPVNALDDNYTDNKASKVVVKRSKEKLDVISGFFVRPGDYCMPGAHAVRGGVNFTIASEKATYCELVLFHRKQTVPYAVLPIPKSYRIGNVYSIFVSGLDVEDFEYAYRMDGPNDPEKGLYFDRNKLLLDPYCRAVTGQRAWGAAKTKGDYHARVVKDKGYWKSNTFPVTPMEDTIIYEMHVRGFTRHFTSGVRYPGTFAGIIEKIPYLKELGITAVELMPVFEFDEMINSRIHKGKLLMEYWGYNTVAFFAPNTSYSASIEFNEEGREFKRLISLLKREGIEVILDVVFNHTAEGNRNGPYYGFKGIDNNVYYSTTPAGEYFNFSGCGNTVNANHPAVIRYIIDCLRYWVTEYHVDGFRFDLASILTRDEDGKPMNDPPLIRQISMDPILANTKLIAEPWDAGGLYQVGSFPAHNRWSEWNGRYRDSIRDFLKGSYWQAKETAARITGSLDMYGKPPYQGYKSSVNFVTCHDGFTLCDLFSYDRKHNEANGWNNTDGTEDNRSWNCGVEGYTDDPVILSLRRKMMCNAITVLMLSRGTPMILAGDEFCNTQYGNNNGYCQDGEISWLNWEYLRVNRDFFEFVKYVIAFRKKHPVISRTLPKAACGLEPVTCCGANPDDHEIGMGNKVLGILYAGRREDTGEDDVVYMVINAHWEPQQIRLPALARGLAWGLNIYTDADNGPSFYEDSLFVHNPVMTLKERSVAVLTLFRQ